MQPVFYSQLRPISLLSSIHSIPYVPVAKKNRPKNKTKLVIVYVALDFKDNKSVLGKVPTCQRVQTEHCQSVAFVSTPGCGIANCPF